MVASILLNRKIRFTCGLHQVYMEKSCNQLNFKYLDPLVYKVYKVTVFFV